MPISSPCWKTRPSLAAFSATARRAAVRKRAGSRARPAGAGPRAPGGRTEALINRGRPAAGRSRTRWVRGHLRAIAIAAAIVGAAIIALVIALPGGGASWPASVAQVQTEITQACENPNVAAEPSQLNFACAKSTQPVLWVFALLTSGNNPGFVDQSTGRKGLEPIQPAQGGDIAFSLNLHQPYNAANPIDSLQVAARAINDIISGATLTNSSGAPLVENGLESTRGQLPALHRLGPARHQVGVPAAVRAAGQHPGRTGGAGERRLPAVDGRHPVADGRAGRGAVR